MVTVDTSIESFRDGDAAIIQKILILLYILVLMTVISPFSPHSDVNLIYGREPHLHLHHRFKYINRLLPKRTICSRAVTISFLK